AIFATRILYTSRGQMVYHESGQGAPLIFLHGVYVGASSYEWSKVYPHFAGTHQVLAVDLLGFGESERPDVILSAADHVRALVEFIRAKSGGERASIVASGLGAGFATILAAQHPEMVQRLILVMPVGQVAFGRRRLPKRYGVFSRVPLLNRGFYQRFLSTRIQIRAWLKNFAFVDPEKITEETIDVLTNCAQQFGADRAIIQWMSGRFDLDLEKRLSELSQPVTLIWGENAADPPPESGYGLESLAKQCNLVVLAKSGVLVALESPIPVIEALVKELDPTIHVHKTD
ncbi:MAG TPA: alpha/beta hydrolase, partial [Chthoniobacterales bacterium]|nr:alpha/beta hydrolase [Chthoniobacterales bacterium]